MKNLRLPPASLIAMFLFTGLSFGLVVSLNRIVTTSGVPFIPYVFWQALCGGGMLFAILCLLRKPPRVTLLHLRAYLIIGALGIAGPYLFLTLISSRLPAGIVALELALVPMSTYAIAMIARLDRFRVLRILGILFGLAAVLLIILPEASLPEPDMIVWVLVGVAAPVLFASSVVACEMFPPPESGSMEMACGLMLAAAILLLPVMAATGEWWAFDSPFELADGLVLVVGAIVATIWCFVFEIVRRAGAVFYSTVLYLETLAGIGWGLIIFGESHSLWIWASLALVLSGVYLVNRTGAARTSQP
jgi:drug/metabolite transporter (DMT)-like permease